jgi:hypothetical protein
VPSRGCPRRRSRGYRRQSETKRCWRHHTPPTADSLRR